MSRGIYLAMPAVVQHIPPTDDTAAAFELGRGRTEAPATDAERRQFEAWMAGHCWACAPWDGKSYTDMASRMLWAAWRDRAALALRHAADAQCSGCTMPQCRDAGRCEHPSAGSALPGADWAADMRAKLDEAIAAAESVAPLPPGMKRSELAREFFGPLTPDESGNDADMCLWALDLYHERLIEQGWQAPPLVVTPNV